MVAWATEDSVFNSATSRPTSRQGWAKTYFHTFFPFGSKFYASTQKTKTKTRKQIFQGRKSSSALLNFISSKFQNLPDPQNLKKSGKVGFAHHQFCNLGNKEIMRWCTEKGELHSFHVCTMSHRQTVVHSSTLRRRLWKVSEWADRRMKSWF
jgi:hypothetical protein